MSFLSSRARPASIALALTTACGGPLLPEITDFSPARGVPGTELLITGLHLDRDARGFPVERGVLPWRVFLAGSARRVELVVTDLGPEALRVVVPDGASIGRILISEGTRTIAESAGTFEIVAHPAILVVNDAQYDVVDLRLGGQQVLEDGASIPSGGRMLVPVTPGAIRVEYGLGEPKAPWIAGVLPAVPAPAPGEVTTARIAPLSVLDALTGGEASFDWRADFKDARDRPASRTLRFYLDGRWAAFDGDAPTDAGTLVEGAWAPYARAAEFRLREGGPRALFPRPFSSFDLADGPAHWPLLRYVAR